MCSNSSLTDSRKGATIEDSKNRPERNEETFNAGDHQRERITLATRQRIDRQSECRSPMYICEEEFGAGCSAAQSKTRRYRTEQWGKRKQRSEPADNVIKNREEIKLLGIAIHVFNGSQPL